MHPKYIEIEALSDLHNMFLNVLSSIGLLYDQNIHTSFVTMRYLHVKFTKENGITADYSVNNFNRQTHE